MITRLRSSTAWQASRNAADRGIGKLAASPTVRQEGDWEASSFPYRTAVRRARRRDMGIAREKGFWNKEVTGE